MKQQYKYIPAGVTVCAFALFYTVAVTTSHAMPQDGAVVSGAATISQPSATTMNINQASGNAIINWQGYSIGANESVKYIQPGSSSIILNRVTGVDPSYIYGLLSGNGQVWVINPNGLLVGAGAAIQTGSFLASTMNINNENFLSGKHLFTNAPDSQASIVNQGNISAANGGYVVLAAPSVTNSGSIVANMGTVHLATGDAITLSLDNGSLINVAVNGDVAANALGVTNTGHIAANGGQVMLTARVAGDVMKSIVNNEGIIEAKSIYEKNGVIFIDSGVHGITINSGTLDASGKNPGETGGTVKVLGDRVGLLAGSVVDVSGDAGGGTLLVGGNFHGAGAETNATMTYVDKDTSIKADALGNGDGGKVAVWADDATRYYGTISAKGGTLGGDGGFVEVSGKRSLTYAGFVDLRAPEGTTGTLLLDPDDITITHGTTDTNITVTGISPFADSSSGAGSILSDTTLNTQLSTASVIVTTTTGDITSQAGVDITLNNNTLTLLSAAGINLAGTYRGTGSLNLNFATTLDLSTAPSFVGGPVVTATGGGASSSIKAAGGTWSLTGVNQGSVAGLNFANAGIITDNDTGTLSTAGSQTYNLTGSNVGNVTNLLPGGFTGIGNLSSTGAASFNMGTGGSVTGNLNGGTAGSINYSSYNNPVTLDLAGNFTTGIGGSWSNIATVTGTAAITDKVTGLDKTYTLHNSIANSGSGASNSKTVTWSSFENITDTGAGVIKFGTAGSVTGNVTTGSGTLDYSGRTTAVNVNLAGTSGSSTGIGGTWSGITTVTGSSNSGDTITGANTAYNLTAQNAGGNGAVTWTGIENLTDTGTGTFNMGTAGSVTGSLDGGSGGTGGTLNYGSYISPVTLNLSGITGTTGIGGAWSNISSVLGNTANSNTVVGSNKTYNLDNVIADKGNNGAVTWAGFKNITDTGTGIFNMGSNGSVSGNLHGGLNGTLNYASYASPVTADLTSKTSSGIGGSWNGIANLTGSNNNDIISGTGKTYNLTGAKAGNSSGVFWTSFENVADSGTGAISTTGGQTYNLTGSNTGNVTTLLPVSFTGIANLTDSGAGVFNFASGGAVTGGITATGGKLDYSAGITGPVAINLTSKSGTGIGTTWSGITTMIGSSGTSDTMGGAGTTYNLTAADGGNSGAVSWSSFEKIADSGTGTISTSGGRTYNLTGANSGNVSTLLPGGYSGIGNLNDTGAGGFRFGSGGSVTGAITATGGTLDYSAGISGPVAVNLTTKNGTGIGGNWSGITTITGSGSSDTLGGAGLTYNLTAANAGNVGGVSWTSFENLQDTGAGNFKFGATGAVTGNISAANGTLDYSAAGSPVTVDLTSNTSSGIGGSWNGITNLTGSNNNDIISGTGKTYNLTGAKAGNSSGVFWTSFENIADSGTGTISTTGGQTYNLTGSNTGNVTTLLPVSFTGIANLTDSGAGVFNFASGGAVTGGITATGGKLDYSAGITGPVAINLTSKSGTGIGTTWSGITTMIGSGASDTMGGAGTTYNLTAADAGNSGAVSWSSFETIADSGTGTIATSYGRTYNLTGANSGNVSILLPGGYSGIGNLSDTGAGSFNFGAGGAVTGSITATGGTLDYSAGIAGPVAVNLTTKNGTGIGGNWSGITTITGSGSSDIMAGANAAYNLTALDAGNDGTVFWTSFENLQDTAAGNFKFGATGAVAGNIAAMNGTLDYSAVGSPVTVDLTSKTVSGIGGNWSGISTIAGSVNTSDIISGSNQTFNLTGADAGNNGTVSWTSFENITGTAGANSYSGSGASLTGALADTGTATILKGDIQTGGAQTYSGAVTLGGATTLASGGSGPITFASTLDSDATARDLTLNTSGLITFSGAAGTTPLNSLTISGGGTTRINGGSVTTSGAAGQLYDSAIVLGPNTILDAGSGSIAQGNSGSLTSTGLLTTRSGIGQTLVGNGTNAIASFNASNSTSGDINLTNNAALLTIAGINQTGGQLIIANSGEITSSAPLLVSGATSISGAGHPVILTNADNDFVGTVTVTGATTQITDKNHLSVILNTTGPTTLTAGADMTLSGTSTDAVTATAVDRVTLSNPIASILNITAATIGGTMSNPSPLNLTTTSDQAPITVNLTGDLPFLNFAGDVKTQIMSLGLYNGAVVMGTELDHYKSVVDLRASTTALAVDTERLGNTEMLVRSGEFYKVAPLESIVDDEDAFVAPEAEPILIDR